MTEPDDTQRGRAIVHEVFARVRRADATVADLFAEDGIITIPGDSAPIVGREEIRAHYERVFKEIAPQPQIEVLLAEPPHFAAVVNVHAAHSPNGSSRPIDLFEIGASGISRLAIYSQR